MSNRQYISSLNTGVTDYAFNEVLNKLLTTVLFLTHQFLNGNSTPKHLLP